MSKQELELLFTATKKYIDEQIHLISSVYGADDKIIGADLERELLDCQSGGMPLDIRPFRDLLRRLGIWYIRLDELEQNVTDILDKLDVLEKLISYVKDVEEEEEEESQKLTWINGSTETTIKPGEWAVGCEGCANLMVID